MGEELEVGCTRPGNEVPDEPLENEEQPVPKKLKEENMIKVGQKAP